MMNAKTNIAIICGDNKTWFYLDSLRITLRYPLKLFPSMPDCLGISNILWQAKKCVNDNFDYVICVIDIQTIKRSSECLAKYQREKQKMCKKVLFIETFPCIEFWFLLHFIKKPSTCAYFSLNEIHSKLNIYMPKYDGSVNFLKGSNIYFYLQKNSDIDTAVDNAKIICLNRNKTGSNENISYSEIYKIIELIKKLKAMES